jgi:hypothetical protein
MPYNAFFILEAHSIISTHHCGDIVQEILGELLGGIERVYGDENILQVKPRVLLHVDWLHRRQVQDHVFRLCFFRENGDAREELAQAIDENAARQKEEYRGLMV